MDHSHHAANDARSMGIASTPAEFKDPENSGRRRLLRVALGSATLPSVCALLGSAAGAARGAEGGQLDARLSPPPAPGGAGSIVRDFADPYLELLRLLHVAAEIEHALMIQYLYAAFSLKPAYHGIVGGGAPGSDGLLGVAIQEMQHLGKVNQLLVALGAAPTLIREDFPYEPDIYPFRFSLEPLSRRSLAKYVWTESPPGEIDVRRTLTATDRAFHSAIEHALGGKARPNYVGTLYDKVIAVLEEFAASGHAAAPDPHAWVPLLKDIKAEGEVGHYQFFKRLFLGTHSGFQGRNDPWSLPASDPRYPTHAIGVDPTAHVGHPNAIPDPQARSLAWLGNLQYWILLMLLATGYGQGSAPHIALARAHMMGPFWSLARGLAAMRYGMPFDPLSLGYARGLTAGNNARLLSTLLDEADRFERQIGAGLPEDYPLGCCRGTAQSLARPEFQPVSMRAPAVPWNDGLA